MKQAEDGDFSPSAESLEEVRSRNLRQLLLRASRVVNRHVVAGLRARGYADLSSTHTTLLSNLDLAGSTVTEVAQRAGISKQAMGRLAAEPEKAGYLRIAPDLNDARVRVLMLTKTGRKLMVESFDVMAGLERRYAGMIGEQRFTQTLEGLAALIEVNRK